ncbi:hypothetical protein CGK40_20015 [Vibrio parahaemolyticus]|uniref:hypothetical protein n=1 Tax=Vibrio parahaemolyticus TaxID=670 RepID=UPI0011739764|nr:hypothetical protein [Vibrio parahaemolyticus]TNZ90909.1 hypothetical protein CGK40_20015 [Vibrio parahaemolyticus]
MIPLFFRLLTIATGFAAIGSGLVDLAFRFADYNTSIDDLFLTYVVMFFYAYMGMFITNEK